MIQSPVAVAFLDNHDVVVAEEYRVQRFNRAGRSLVVVGRYSLKPAGVAITKDGLFAVTDKVLRTVRFFHDDGRDVSPARRWPERLFGMPAGLAVARSSGNVVVVDAERRTVTVHVPGTRPPSPAVPQCTIPPDQLGSPTHVTVDNCGTVFVSDALHSSIKVNYSLCLLTLRLFVNKMSFIRKLFSQIFVLPLPDLVVACWSCSMYLLYIGPG